MVKANSKPVYLTVDTHTHTKEMAYISKRDREDLTAAQTHLKDCIIRFWVDAAPELLGKPDGKASGIEVFDCIERFRVSDVLTDEDFSVEIRNRARLLMYGVTEKVYDRYLGTVAPISQSPDFNIAFYSAYGLLSQLERASRSTENRSEA